MVKISFNIVLFLLIIFLSACTNPRWIISENNAIDPNDFEVLSTRQFLGNVDQVTPEDPVLRLELLSEKKYRYARKIVTQRHVQDYKLNWKMFTLPLAGAGISFWSAHSTGIINNGSRINSLSLNAAGGILTLVSLLAVKPEGEPRPTGERQYLRTTDTVIVTDTTTVDQPQFNSATVSLSYQDQILIDSASIQLQNSSLQINLGDPLANLQLTGPGQGEVEIIVTYGDKMYNYTYPIESILQPFASVTVPVTELRNSPSRESGNILAELAESSQLRITGEVDETWYQVMYGISETYLPKSDTRMIWQTSENANDNRVITLPSVPFGNIDVENNIPIIDGSNANGVGLVITNEEYGDEYPNRNYAGRDGRLIKTYLSTAFGYPQNRVFHLSDASEPEIVWALVDTLKTVVTDSTHLMVYLSGYASLKSLEDKQEMRMHLAGSQDTASAPMLDLNALLSTLGGLKPEKSVVFADLDFSEDPFSISTINDISFFDQPLRTMANQFISDNRQSAVVFSTRIDQKSHLYTSGSTEDKKHHIFPYFIAKSIQQRKLTVAELVEFLERNISYTARRLHDQPQEPLAVGDLSISLVE